MKPFERDLEWVSEHMPITRATIAALPDLSGVRLACSMHLDIKMIVAIDGLLARGAHVFMTTCNPATVRDEVVAHCVARGSRNVEAHAWHGMSSADYSAAVERAIAWSPTHLCEMGAEITSALASGARATQPPVQASLEATGSGITRLGKLTPAYPIFNWDDIAVKEGLHNRHMVGITACHAFFNRTRLTFHNKRVLVVGYGLVGRGVCDAARAYGGRISVAEIDAGRALEATFAGLQVIKLEDGLPAADVIITATGARHVINARHFGLLKSGAFVLNVGHLNEEIDMLALYANPHNTALPFVERVTLGERHIYVLADGGMANLSAGEGDSLNAFDVTLAVMVAGIGFIVESGGEYAPGIHTLPKRAWTPVAQRALL